MELHFKAVPSQAMIERALSAGGDTPVAEGEYDNWSGQQHAVGCSIRRSEWRQRRHKAWMGYCKRDA